MRPFESAEGTPLLLHSAIACLDLLGFTEQMRKAQSRGPYGLDHLQKLHSVLQKWYYKVRTRKGRGRTTPRVLKTFSDNIVIAMPMTGGFELGVLARDLAVLQLGLITDGIFVRGAVTVGNICVTNDLIYGMGLVDAYIAEQTATTPRIVLTEAAARELEDEHGHVCWTAGTEWEALLARDEDNKLMINYLDAACSGKTRTPNWSLIDRHRRAVSDGLKQYQQQPRVWGKYFWAARYHNGFCVANGSKRRHHVRDHFARMHMNKLSDESGGRR